MLNNECSFWIPFTNSLKDGDAKVFEFEATLITKLFSTIFKKSSPFLLKISGKSRCT